MLENQGNKEYLSIAALLRRCLVPEFKAGIDRPADKEDFTQFLKDQKTRLKNLQEHQRAAKDDPSKLYTKQVMVPFILFYFENSKEMAWNDAEIVAAATQMKGCILALCPIDGLDVGTLLNYGINHGKNWKMESLFRPLLKELRQKLLKESWKKNPAAVECLRNIVELANFTHIAENVASIMPIGLMLTDDFVLENRLIGVGIVSSLCEHMTVAELKHHGHGEVFYKALVNCIRVRDPRMVKIAPYALANLCHKLDATRPNEPLPFEWSRMDDFLEIWLEAIEIENKHEMRQSNAAALVDLIKFFDGKLHTWCRRILRISADYLNVDEVKSTPETVENILQMLTIFVEMTKAFSLAYRFELARILSRFRTTKDYKKLESREIIKSLSTSLFDLMWVKEDGEDVMITEAGTAALKETIQTLNCVEFEEPVTSTS